MKLSTVAIFQVLSLGMEMTLSSLNVGGLGAEPDDVGGHESHAGAHDDEERVQPGVRLQRLPCRTLQKILGKIF